MMGIHQPQPELFSYQVNLEKRVRVDHPLRRVAQAVDFAFVRAEVAGLYGDNGHESVDPVILLKMMFLLFYDNVPSEREFMSVWIIYGSWVTAWMIRFPITVCSPRPGAVGARKFSSACLCAPLNSVW